MLAKQLKLKQRKKGLCLSMLLCTLGSSLLGNILISKEAKAKIYVRRLLRVGQGKIRVS